MSLLFGPTRQLGFVVQDFDRTLEDWIVTQGVGPFHVMREVAMEDYLHRGMRCEAPVISVGIAYSGDLQIEILHQHNRAPSIYTEFLSQGREGIHHICGFTDRSGFDVSRARAIASGCSPVLEGSIGGGRFAYFDTMRTPASILCEISEADMDGPRQFFDTLKRDAVDWDGSDPIRLLLI